MIFQEPMTALNPVYTCGEQIIETIVLHERLSRRDARLRAIEMLDRVGIPAAAQRVDEYPHQMSGGMRQRVMIAMALACRPAVLIADEPTTALDVTIQAQILELLKVLQRELGMAVILITHDLGVVAETADRVAVMYGGQVVEYCDVGKAFGEPLHPYTAGLQASLPQLGVVVDRLRVIPGTVPNPARFPAGCRFHPRCPVMIETCLEEPPIEPILHDHLSRCWRAREIAAGTLDPVPPAGSEGPALRGPGVQHA
jgi:peptide/nickel transport system ATP-binding protein